MDQSTSQCKAQLGEAFENSLFYEVTQKLTLLCPASFPCTMLSGATSPEQSLETLPHSSMPLSPFPSWGQCIEFREAQGLGPCCVVLGLLESGFCPTCKCPPTGHQPEAAPKHTALCRMVALGPSSVWPG